MTICFFVPGRPVPKGRPRVTRYGTYTPKSTVEFESRVSTVWRLKSGECFPPKVPLQAVVAVHFEIPKSESKKRKAAMVGTPHVSRGDLDNVVKAVLDVKIENSQLHNYIWTCKKGTIRKARIVPFPYFL